ncbi:hypothetical protein SAY86_002077 [Trapa natans]|uniref:Uncharacterized protein n=1 Tax=Trapa natans TaxID=22666 RepID=A0AAN7R4E5_TRANT|nr:hypothetical protein SAY86_002077 [Trapa natans]
MRNRGGTRHPHGASEAVEDEEAVIGCTGQHCGSCTGVVIADCVALCCCPCAVVSILNLALFKAPWMAGRRCLRRLSKRRRSKKCHFQRSCSRCGGDFLSEGMDSKIGFGLEERIRRWSFGGFEAEDDHCLEQCPVGHLSFGRVSSTDF